MKRVLILLCAALIASASSQSTSGLGQLATKMKLNLGSAAPAELLQDHADGGQYEKALAAETNMLEPENDLKPPALWMGIGNYNFVNADFILGAPGHPGWAAQHGLKVRGHVLLYARDEGYTIPRWLLAMEKQITPDQAKDILRDYIHAVVGRYKGKIFAWDVVNEAIGDQPTGNPFNLRNSFWFRKLGPDFLMWAAKFAHEADPHAELYYNEYGLERGGPKADETLALVAYAKKKGAAITGIGLQYHGYRGQTVTPGDGHYGLLAKIKQAKLAFMITELDIPIPVVPYPRNDPQFGVVPKNAGDLTWQADLYRSIFRMALSFPNCHGIQCWGITDKHSWIPGFSPGNGAALLLDADYQQKPAYKAVAAELATHVPASRL